MCLPQTRFDAKVLFDELLAMAREQIFDKALCALVVDLLETNREALLTLPAHERLSG